jgi:hypothetical protein
LESASWLAVALGVMVLAAMAGSDQRCGGWVEARMDERIVAEFDLEMFRIYQRAHAEATIGTGASCWFRLALNRFQIPSSALPKYAAELVHFEMLWRLCFCLIQSSSSAL